ncbi:Hypothetical protein CINCED_3A019280 [Cinara cedri]|uniref:Uncharacterized protein n=1 Tax=Cinara cedri TaxID=506608 RepID=A0A5E4MNE1_9HEMI|nr:Hypothetical protein CINCED_3A019280 [Cinara cedri]
MKILIFLNMVFLLAECVDRIEDLRKRNELTSIQKRNFMAMIEENKNIHEIINNNPIKTSYLYKIEENEREKPYLKEIKKTLDKVSYVFLNEIYFYLLQHMYLHCQVSRYLIDISLDSNKEISPEEVIRAIKLMKDQEYCIFTYIYDSGFEFELTLDVMFYLKSFTETDLSVIKEQLKNSMANIKLNKLFKELNSDINKSLGDLTQTSNADKLELFDKILTKIKQEILDSSNMFCSTTNPPLISKNMFYTLGLNNTGYFIRYIYITEQFYVNFSTVNGHKFPLKKIRIDSWDCRKILETEEYKFDKYKKERQGSTSKLSQILFSVKNQVNTPTYEASWKWPDPETNKSQNINNLVGLQEKLKTDPYYLNIVKYDNILADVMMYVAIKEGTKILKGIKHIIKNQCELYFQTDAKHFVLDETRLSLLLFKFEFDDFINAILEKKRIDLRENEHVKKFNNSVKNLLQWLDRPKSARASNDKIIQNCKFINGALDEIKYPLADSKVDDKFKTFYMEDPLFNIRTLIGHILRDI